MNLSELVEVAAMAAVMAAVDYLEDLDADILEHITQRYEEALSILADAEDAPPHVKVTLAANGEANLRIMKIIMQAKVELEVSRQQWKNDLETAAQQAPPSPEKSAPGRYVRVQNPVDERPASPSSFADVFLNQN